VLEHFLSREPLYLLAAGQASSPFDHDGSELLLLKRSLCSLWACSLLELIELLVFGLIGSPLWFFGAPKSVIFGEMELSSFSSVDKSRCHKLASNTPPELQHVDSIKVPHDSKVHAVRPLCSVES
jgi:hypothetical protein